MTKPSSPWREVWDEIRHDRAKLCRAIALVLGVLLSLAIFGVIVTFAVLWSPR